MVSFASSSRPHGPSAKPSQHRPVLPKKRTDSMAEIDDFGLMTPMSPSKRPKVQFRQDVEVRTTDEFDKPLEIIREEVSRALARHRVGDSTEYLNIKSAFDEQSIRTPRPDGPSRRRLLQALTGNATSLTRHCADLVSLIISSDWLAEDPEYVETFRRFLLVLISASSSWTGEVLETLVQKFSRPVSTLTNSTILSRTEAQRRLHLIVRSILDKFPDHGPKALRSSLETLYPAQWDSTKTHVLYVHNLFKVIEYAPHLEASILSLVAGKLVSLDMQIQTDIEEMDDLDELLVADAPSNLDNFMDSLEDDDDDDLSDDDDEDMNDDDEDMNDDAGPTAEEKAKAVRKDILKMDVLMDLAFTHYESAFTASPDAQEKTFNFLESQFETFLLPSFRSRHTQFLLFHFAQTSPALVDRFVGTCLTKAMDKSKNSHVRQSAAAYLASFVARGNHVSAQFVRDVFNYVGAELADLRELHEPNCRGPDLSRYGTYYSLVQALIYIFCFRWRDLESTPSDPGSPMSTYNSLVADDAAVQHSFISGVKETLDQNILSPLNPLKICSPIIVEEFAKVAHHVGILYLFPKIEMNKRLRLVPTTISALDRESALSGRKDESLLQLDEYFPFDPYLLPRSKRWLQGDYREFESLPGDEDETDSENEEEYDEAGEDALGSDSDSE